MQTIHEIECTNNLPKRWKEIAMDLMSMPVYFERKNKHTMAAACCFIASLVFSGDDVNMDTITKASKNTITSPEELWCSVVRLVQLTWSVSTPSPVDMPPLSVCLGEGNSKVYQILHKGKTCALKVFDVFDKNGEFNPILFLRESFALSKMKHHRGTPNALGAWTDARNKRACIVFEKYDTNLYDLLAAGGGCYKMSPDELVYFCSELVDILMTAHNVVRLAHRDIKPQNIMVNLSATTSKITKFILNDWDAACLPNKDGQKKVAAKFYTDVVCTVPYRSPEYFHPRAEPTKNGMDCFALDMWSLGCLLWFCASGGKTAFPGNSEACVQFYQRDWFDRLQREVPRRIRKALGQKGVEFMLNLMIEDPAKRMTSSQAFRHPYIAKYTQTVYSGGVDF